jgi:hypothetical protein
MNDRPTRRGFLAACSAAAAALGLTARARPGYPSPPTGLTATWDPMTPRTWGTLAFDPATGTEIVTLREGPNTFVFSRTGPDYRLWQIAPRPVGGPCYTSPPMVNNFWGGVSGDTPAC